MNPTYIFSHIMVFSTISEIEFVTSSKFLILMSAAASGDAPPDAAANFFLLKCHKTL